MTTNDKSSTVGVGQPIDDPLLAAARANPTLAVAAVTGALVVARLLAVANYRVDVALALLASAGVANVVIGSALTLLPLFAPLFAVVLINTARAYERAGRRALVTLLAGFVAVLASILLSAALYFAFFAIGEAVIWAYARVRARRGRPSERPREDPVAWVISVAVFPIAIYLAFLTTPWLPPETITSNGATVVGYVTSSDSSWTDVLLYQPRVVRIYQTSTITSRTACQLPPNFATVRLTELLRRSTDLPDCPVP